MLANKQSKNILENLRQNKIDILLERKGERNNVKTMQDSI